MKNNDIFINYLLETTYPKLLIRPIKALLKTPIVRAKAVVDFSEEQIKKYDHKEKFLKILKTYKQNNLECEQVLSILQEELKPYNIEIPSLPKMVYGWWDEVS